MKKPSSPSHKGDVNRTMKSEKKRKISAKRPSSSHNCTKTSGSVSKKKRNDLAVEIGDSAINLIIP